MVGRLVTILMALGLAAAPAFAQLPPEAQEKVDKIHLVAGDFRLADVETLSEVFERKGGDLLHKPSGFVCPHSAATLSGFQPGFVTIFDDPKVTSNIGCGMLAPDVNITVHVTRNDTDLHTLLLARSQNALRANPAAAPQNTALIPPVDADSLGLAGDIPFARDNWVDRQGAVQAIYLARFGGWHVSVRLTMNPSKRDIGMAQVKRIFALAAETIKR